MSEENKNILIDVPMPIVTPRLTLRPVQAGDGSALTEAKAESWDTLSLWMIWTKATPDAATDEAYVRDRYEKFLAHADMTIVGFENGTDRAVIWTGIHNIDWEKRTCSIGYWVRQSAHGKGYATESTNALLRYAFNALGMNRVEIFHADGNEASRRVIEKLGFQKEAVLEKSHLLPDGRTVDGHAYAQGDTDGLPPLDVRWGLP